MTTSDNSWSPNLRQITDIERPDHYFLEDGDNCSYFGEYTARRGYEFSRANDIIINFKKPVSRRGRGEYRHKESAINGVAASLRAILTPAALTQYCMVPIPPSKRRDHPEYDDRMTQVCTKISASIPFCNLLETAANRVPAHESVERPGPDALYEGLAVHDDLLPMIHGKNIILLDDVLCTGASFKACKRKIIELSPAANVYGFFIARRVPERGLPAGVFF